MRMHDVRRGETARRFERVRKGGHEWGECRGKERYRNEGDAHEMIASRRRHGWQGVLRAYECRFCGGFHLTSQPLRGTEQEAA